jgi:hypothetical protein
MDHCETNAGINPSQHTSHFLSFRDKTEDQLIFYQFARRFCVILNKNNRNQPFNKQNIHVFGRMWPHYSPLSTSHFHSFRTNSSRPRAYSRLAFPNKCGGFSKKVSQNANLWFYWNIKFSLSEKLCKNRKTSPSPYETAILWTQHWISGFESKFPVDHTKSVTLKACNNLNRQTTTDNAFSWILNCDNKAMFSLSRHRELFWCTRVWIWPSEYFVFVCMQAVTQGLTFEVSEVSVYITADPVSSTTEREPPSAL